MADQKNAATPEAPKAPKAPSVKPQELFPSPEAATKEAESRTKGPRRAFTCELNGKTFNVVANNEGRAGGVAFLQLGGKVTEIGKAPKANKVLGVDAVMAAINAMPEDQRGAILAQLKTIGGATKPAGK